ncbi:MULTISPECIES: nitroreductase family deazaflavin-dependent oxidoreductase [Prauserella salsuginis group]|uniref:Deazaflavin-dependent oxidoreductase (Nitroreductase family) n=2 Tax=Prauserella salsuginis group TaxID=2893672 RepID=A0A839XHJ1_9PSEU|nr:MULTISPECIES: nitroreductase family deazaflavin-dependent oxidoreductase [Prauserella salsuginis group]MBB3662750.1 deazaflavin-dependent oxidoreductase (nitroreductase family) [Prauserella sediminis]MCR3720447.1 deazaflavin-dependent oxidoreductase, nitroreductase family [Prauserella flava]MCR3733843.1 deazaflavin-dependent oxidoreductase, nitroreductase family [Prauserella salsuginis]
MRRLLISVLVAVAAALGAFVVAMRRKSPAVQDRVRQFSKHVMTPAVLPTAGTAGRGNGVVHHRGRTSGREYATPVTPVPISGGFLIALPYTSRVDWARNILAAGEATIVHDGASHRVVDPAVMPYGDVADLLPPSARIGAKVFSMEEFLRVRTAG